MGCEHCDPDPCGCEDCQRARSGPAIGNMLAILRVANELSDHRLVKQNRGRFRRDRCSCGKRLIEPVDWHYAQHLAELAVMCEQQMRDQADIEARPKTEYQSCHDYSTVDRDRMIHRFSCACGVKGPSNVDGAVTTSQLLAHLAQHHPPPLGYHLVVANDGSNSVCGGLGACRICDVANDDLP